MYLIQAAASSVLLMLAVYDLRARRLPNLAVAGFAALYFMEAALAGTGLHSLAMHAAAGGFALILAAVLFRFGWLGGGDVKLAAAIFLWAGPSHAMTVFFVVSVCGLAAGIAVLLAGAMLNRRASAAGRLAWLAPARGVPYGVALAPGGAAAVWLPGDVAHQAALAFAAHSFSASIHHAAFALLGLGTRLT